MKKIFLIGLTAAAMLASCSNDETVEMAQQKAISFSNAFVNNGTRSVVDPSFTTSTLKDFAVYGFTQNGQIFNGEKVSGTTSTGWSYDNVQYWVPGNTYTFGAIAPYSVAGNVSNVTLPTGATKVEMEVAFTNKDADQVDLLHAAPTQITGVTASYTNPVGMTFNHQLSKVKFSFENAVGAGYNVRVKDVKITDAYAKGTLTVAAAGNNWSNQTDKTLELNFGNVVADASTTEASVIANAATLESYNEKLMIPMENTAIYTVKFTAELYKGNVLLGTYPHTVEIKNVEFKLGYCYNFKASLTHKNITGPDELNPIKFNVTSVENWNQTESNKDLNVPTTHSGI
mgnify:FL=1